MILLIKLKCYVLFELLAGTILTMATLHWSPIISDSDLKSTDICTAMDVIRNYHPIELTGGEM